MPPDLAARYYEALEAGRQLAQSLRTHEQDPSYARGLAIAVAAMSGNAAEARRLDHLDDEE